MTSRGTIPHLVAEQSRNDRKLVCLMLVEHTNGIKVRSTERCPNERLPGADLCSKHLGQAVNDFRRITGGDGEAPG